MGLEKGTLGRAMSLAGILEAGDGTVGGAMTRFHYKIFFY